MIELPPERQYVLEIGRQLGIETKLVYHSRATDTCAEKIKLLQETHPEISWRLEHAVKAIYGKIDEKMYGFVVPELKRKIDSTVVGKVFSILDLDPPYSSEFIADGSIPVEMESGTCTPFVSAKEMEGLEMLFVHDSPQLDPQTVDVSIGGKGEYFHRVSLHLSYKAIYDILEQQYGKNKVKKVRFF